MCINIARLPDKYSDLARGFACAQLNRHELIRSAKHPVDLVRSVLDHIKRPVGGKKLSWLCITINDFGIGLAQTVSHALKSRIGSSEKLEVGRFLVDESDLNNEALLIKIASTTDFSAKKVRIPQDLKEVWKTRDEVYPLAGRGYGLVYCIGFIARTYGRMRIRSGCVELDIFPKPDTPMEENVWSNPTKAAARLKEGDFPFDVEERYLSVEEGLFPGTQLMIEIPVYTWIDRSTKDADYDCVGGDY